MNIYNSISFFPFLRDKPYALAFPSFRPKYLHEVIMKMFCRDIKYYLKYFKKLITFIIPLNIFYNIFKLIKCMLIDPWKFLIRNSVFRLPMKHEQRYDAEGKIYKQRLAKINVTLL